MITLSISISTQSRTAYLSISTVILNSSDIIVLQSQCTASIIIYLSFYTIIYIQSVIRRFSTMCCVCNFALNK